MQAGIMKRAVAGAVAAAAMLLAGAAQAALQDRDLDGDTVVDAFYDTDLDITWLRNANVNGAINWATAVAWVDGYSIGGYSDWRLPTSDICFVYNCTGSEMGHLWYVELGNTAGTMTNMGDFQNLEREYHWSSTLYPLYGDRMVFSTDNGWQTADHPANRRFAFAVHPGDVGAVPEPETLALMLAGLAALVLARRQRRS